MLLLIWVNISVHFSISVVVSDVCYDVYQYTIPVWLVLCFVLTSLKRRMEDRYDNGTYGGLNDFIRCVSFNNTCK